MENIQRNDIIKYLQDTYIPSRLVIAIAGNLDHQEVQAKAAEIFGAMKPRQTDEKVTIPENIQAVSSNLTRDTGQVHICLGTGGLSQQDERIHTLYILNNVLGGGLSSRLVQSIREERSLAYSVFSYHSAFVIRVYLLLCRYQSGEI